MRVYVGRACRGYTESPLHNPFQGLSKEEALARYRVWLRDAIRDPASAQARELVRLAELVAADAEVTLLCWCATTPAGLRATDPHICHAQIVAGIIEKVSRRIKGEVEPPER